MESNKGKYEHLPPGRNNLHTSTLLGPTRWKATLQIKTGMVNSGDWWTRS